MPERGTQAYALRVVQDHFEKQKQAFISRHGFDPTTGQRIPKGPPKFVMAPGAEDTRPKVTRETLPGGSLRITRDGEGQKFKYETLPGGQLKITVQPGAVSQLPVAQPPVAQPPDTSEDRFTDDTSQSPATFEDRFIGEPATFEDRFATFAAVQDQQRIQQEEQQERERQRDEEEQYEAEGGLVGFASDEMNRLIRGFASGGMVGGFTSSVASSGYAGVSASAQTGTGGASAYGYHQLDIRTNAGNIRAAVSEETMNNIRRSALNSKLSQTGPRPTWYS